MPLISINTEKAPHIYVSSLGLTDAESTILTSCIPQEWQEQIASLLAIEKAACKRRVALTESWRIQGQPIVDEAYNNLRATHPEIYI